MTQLDKNSTGKKPTEVGIVLVKGDRLLLNLRDNKPDIVYLNCWAFLGGHIETGETEEEAVKREVLEEIGYEIKETHKLENIFLEEWGLTSAVFFSKINATLDQLDLTEGRELKFFEYSEIKSLNMPEILKKILTRHESRIFAAN